MRGNGHSIILAEKTKALTDPIKFAEAVSELTVEKAILCKPMACTRTPQENKKDLVTMINTWNTTLTDRMNPMQVAEAAMLIWAECRDLTIDEIALALQRIKAGYYELSWAKMSPSKVVEGINQYRGSDERLTMMENRHKKMEMERMEKVFSEDKRERDRKGLQQLMNIINESIQKERADVVKTSDMPSYSEYLNAASELFVSLIEEGKVQTAVSRLQKSIDNPLSEIDAIAMLEKVFKDNIKGVQSEVGNGWKIIYFSALGERFTIKVADHIRGENENFIIQSIRGWKPTNTVKKH